MELMCLSRERWESRVTPRILMWSDNETEQPATFTERKDLQCLIEFNITDIRSNSHLNRNRCNNKNIIKTATVNSHQRVEQKDCNEGKGKEVGTCYIYIYIYIYIYSVAYMSKLEQQRFTISEVPE